MLPPRLPETLEIVVKSQYGAALAGEPSELADCGRRLLDRISPPNWTLEWSLPGWLGNAHGLDTSTIADLTLANVFGLAYIKLQDDLLDGEVGGDDRQAALLLSSVLHRKWLLVYSGLFPGGSLFWRYFEQYMTQWVRATWASRQEHSKPWAAWGEEDLLILGQRGAPLKICAAAACLLAQRAELIPQLESALDHLLIGAVLLDHALDWAEDLAAGQVQRFCRLCVWLAADGRASGGQPPGGCGGASGGQGGTALLPVAAPGAHSRAGDGSPGWL